MKHLLLISLMIISSYVLSQTVTLTGSIGPYNIEMELSKNLTDSTNLKGKYNYKGKTAYLSITGNLFNDDVLQLNEYYKNEHTGSFYLQKTKDSLKGRWIAGKKHYNVGLHIKNNNWESIVSNKVVDLNKKTSNSITGSYVTENYFVNDMWFRDDNPQVEIGFNGGYLILEEIDADTLQFTLQNICGPTYHFASATGKAVRIDKNTFLYSNKSKYSDDTCSFTIEIKNKVAEVKQKTASFACGFGARAYADGTFIKVKNKVPKKEEEFFLEDIFDLEN